MEGQIRSYGGEIRLGQKASRRILPACDRKEMIICWWIGVDNEKRAADRPIGGDEKRNRIRSSILSGDSNHRIRRRTRATRRREVMAPGATIHVEPRAQAESRTRHSARYRIDFLNRCLPGCEKLRFLTCESRQRSARSWGAAARARIHRRGTPA